MRVLIIITLLLSSIWGLGDHDFTHHNIEDGKFMGVKILDSKVIDIKKVSGEDFYGISALSYDQGSDILYMLSDRGRLFSTRVVLKNQKIDSLTVIDGFRLRDQNGKKFLKPKRDSEGMVIVKDGKKELLLISFELFPRVLAFDFKGEGVETKEIELNLPKELKNIRNYQGRNSALESLAYHKKYGFLTTPEYPLKSQKSGFQGIYNSKGEVCRFKKRYFDNAVTAIEVMNSGDLLVLQRDISLRDFTINISLKRVYLRDIKDRECRVEDIAIFQSKDGWSLDNFEGLTHYKDNIYFMISDDNGNYFQQTILTVFELTKL